MKARALLKLLSVAATAFGVYRILKGGKSPYSDNPIVKGVSGGFLSIFKFLGYLWLAGYATMFALWLAEVEGFDSSELPMAFVLVSAITFILFFYLSTQKKQFDPIAFLILMPPGIFVTAKPFLQ